MYDSKGRDFTCLLVRVVGWDGGVSEAMQGLCVEEGGSVYDKNSYACW